ncbi:MAG: DUF4388 domain-containing protein [Acidobacteria bacterium]|nr:MAG: DUF4388 domain-containing protein [Acidobacteriota bacterium]REK08352.1 MAG: DUF4388 domain-containing protein [Acidobacteriota bacterium]
MYELTATAQQTHHGTHRPPTVTLGGTRHVFHADLAEQSLADLLARIDRHRLSGVLEAEQDGVRKQLHLRDGYVLFASSSDRRDSLGAHLVRRRVLTREAIERLRDLPDFKQKRLGTMLMEQQLLLPNQIRTLVQQQVANIAWSLFSWESGAVSFELGELRDDQPIRIQIPLKHMVLKGNRRAPAVDRMLASLGGKEARYAQVHDSEAIIDAALDETEYALFLSIDGQRDVGELIQEPPLEPDDNVRLLHALRAIGLILPVGG